MEEIKTYREMDMIRSNMREYKDGEWVKHSDHKAVVEDLTRKFESQREQTHKNFQYVDQKNHEINKLNHDIETMQNKIDELENLVRAYKNAVSKGD